MKGQEYKERPGFGLMKQSDVVRFYHLQFPRWLIEDRRYMTLGMEAKFVYMLLFNRFQLSRHKRLDERRGRGFRDLHTPGACGKAEYQREARFGGDE